jgi:hypothetical protein
MALQVFTQARAGLEATRGTAVTPTRILHGTSFTHEQTVATIRPEELRNNYEGFFTAAAGRETNTFGYGGLLSYDDAVLVGNLFFSPLGTASGTAGAAYTYTFAPSGTADNVKSLAVQLGYADTIATAPGVSLAGVVGNTLHLHWEKNDDAALLFDMTFLTIGTATQITAFTGTPTDPVTTPASMNATQVFLDASTIGSTADSNVVSVDWTLNLNPVPFYALNNTAGASALYRPQHRTWSGTIVRQFANDTEWDIYQSKAERKMRIRTLGPTLGAANYKIDLDLYGVWTGRAWADVDGIITEELTLEPYADTAAGTVSMGLVVVTSLGTLA